MKYLLFICADGLPAPEELAVLQRECPRWVEEMDGRGVRLFGQELDLPETAATVRVRFGETLVTDGPFADTKEFVAGFDVVECADLDEAIEVASKHPSSWFQTIEIRPFGDGLQLGDRFEAFARGDDARGAAFCLMMCLDGIPGTPTEEEAVRNEGERWRHDLEMRGIQVFGHPLQHKEMATTVRVRDGETLISDGPFVETKEFIGGVDVIECAGREEAIEIAAAHPLARYHMVEVRQFVTE
jgi:hypothetical protein